MRRMRLKAGEIDRQKKKKTMANVDVVNLNGDKVGSIELADAYYAPEQINEGLLWEAVKHYRASLRQGTGIVWTDFPDRIRPGRSLWLTSAYRSWPWHWPRHPARTLRTDAGRDRSG